MESRLQFHQHQQQKPELKAYIFAEYKENETDSSVLFRVFNKDLAESIEKAEHLTVEEVNLLDEDKKDEKDKKDDRTVKCLYINLKDIPTKVSKYRSVSKCAYMATEAYIKHNIGGQFDQDDSKWYDNHFLCTPNGLPQAHTLTVLQQLTEPYEIGISRVVVPRMGRIFNEYKPFIHALGANPFFLTDNKTTNEEALIKLFPDEALRNKHRDQLFSQWKFECRDEPLRKSVMMRIFSDGPGHNGGSTYRGPRDNNKADRWIFSIRFDKLSNIKYLKSIELPEYKEFEGFKEYDFDSIKDGDKRLIERGRKPFFFERNWLDRKNDSLDVNSKAKDIEECPLCKQNPGRYWQMSKRTCIECGNPIEQAKELKDNVIDMSKRDWWKDYNEDEELNAFFGIKNN